MADVPQRLDLGLGLGKADPEAYFRRLALYSYAVAPLFPGRRPEGQYAPGLRQYAAGGRILQDEYPTSYMPEVGRQVMADGGAPLSPEDQRAMTHYEGGPGVVEMAPVKFREPLSGYERELFQAPAATAPVLEAGLEFAPYLTPAAPALAARDVVAGLKHGDPVELATAALGAPGKYAKAAILGAAAMMPEEAQATFFGSAAKMSPKIREALEMAKRATARGMSPEGTWALHGFAPDPAGKMIGEVSDLPARLIPSGLEKFRSGQQLPLGELLSHPEVYDLYPGSFSSPVIPFDRSPSHRGYFNQIKDELGSNVRLSDRDLLENLLHEHQHRIQHIEGMSPGTSPDVFPSAERLAAPLKEDLQSANGAMALKAFMERNPTLKPIDAIIEARKAGIPLGPQPLKFSSLGQEELRNTQDLLSSQINRIYETTPDPYQEYSRSLGEVTARLPGERLEMSPEERRLSYPFPDPSQVIVRPISPAVLPNRPNPRWERAREDALALSRQLQERPLPPRLEELVSPEEEALMQYAQELEAQKRAGQAMPPGGALPTIRKDKGGSVIKAALKTLGKLMPEGSGYASVPGKPALVNLPGIGKVEARPIPAIESAAEKYMQSAGRPGEHAVSSFPEFNPAFATKVAEAFAEMKHRPGDPAVRRAYDALIDETMAQYRAAKDTGIDFRFLKEGQQDPYAASPALGYEDIVNRGRLFVFPTEQGFGSSGGLIADNPLLKRAGQVGDKPDAVVNDAFRIVHDLYGHFGPGNPFFRAPGEERAYQLHSRMFGPEALPAATLETRGQNSWLNYGPYGEANRSALGADTRFAEQKIGRMPEWTQAPAPAVGEDVEAYIRSLTGKAEGGEVERGGFDKGGVIKSAIAAAEALARRSRETVPIAERMMAVHQARPGLLADALELGSLPMPSIGIAQPIKDPLKFGQAMLVGRPHLASPSQINPVFAQDIASPRVPGGSKNKTAEEIVNAMKERPLIGGEWWRGPGSGEAEPFDPGYVAAKLAPRFGSFEELLNARKKLVSPSEYENIAYEFDKKYRKLAEALEPVTEIQMPQEARERYLGRALLQGDPSISYPRISDPQRQMFANFLEEAKNLPSQYFEGKPLRPVSFGEFGGAIVPKEDYDTLAPMLEKAGVEKVVPYRSSHLPSMLPALEHFPELSFERGGHVERENMRDGGDPDMVSRALDLLSQLNPVGAAQAETLPGVVAKALARKIVPTVKNMARKEPVFPGVYGNPREMAAEAESRVAPEDPIMKQLFGVTRQDIFDIAARRAGNAPPVLKAPPERTRGVNYAAEGVMTPKNERRLLDILTEGEKQPGLRTGMMPWYYMDPVYNRMEQMFGPEEAAKRYNIFNTTIGAMSPGSPVQIEINRGLGAYHLATQGRIEDFLNYGGNPSAAPEGTLPSYVREAMLGHPYHSTSQAGPLKRFFETGEYKTGSPKVPLYIQASGVPETGFQTTLPVPDAHYTRILGMPDVRKADAPGTSMKMGEYRPIGPWFRERVAKRADMEAVPAQALLWGTGSGATGVDTPIGSPKLEMLAQEIANIARRRGVTPETARDLVLRGELYADGGSVIDDAIRVSSNVANTRELEAA